MKLKPGFALLLWIFNLLAVADIFANNIIVGGYVPERRNFSVTPTPIPLPTRALETIEIATIIFDNNLPNYQLVLDFTDRNGNANAISEVRLQAVDGTLGSGLEDFSETILASTDASSRFVWMPGPQKSATLNFQIRVLVTYERALAADPILTVSMPSTY